jgi:hypothetical protein
LPGTPINKRDRGLIKKNISKMSGTDSSEIERRKEVFMEWLTFIDDRIKEWRKTISVEIAQQLNGKPESLEIAERYLIEHFKLDDHREIEKRVSLDAIVSYVGIVFCRNIPGTIWKIDVEDTSNAYYNLPYLVFKLGVPLCPHHLVQDALYNSSGKEFSERFQGRMEKWIEYDNYMKSKSKN